MDVDPKTSKETEAIPVRMDGNRGGNMSPPNWRVTQRDGVVRLDPHDGYFRTVGSAFCLLMAAIFIAGAYWSGDSILALALLPFSIVYVFFYWNYTHELNNGPWLIYHAQSETIALPRIPIEVRKGDVVGIQDIHGYDPDGHYRNSSSEMNLLVRTTDGLITKYPLVGGMGAFGVKKATLKLSSWIGVPAISTEAAFPLRK